MPRTLVNGVELFHDELGSGPPVLMHHGYTGSHDVWLDEIGPRLADRYRCIVMDARGAGDSAHPEGGYTIEQYARDVVGLADALGLDRFSYVGHSMGGGIGMSCAEAGLDVTLIDVSEEGLAKGLAAVEANFNRSRRLTDEQKVEHFGRMSGSTDYADLADCDLVVEAVFENMEVKKLVYMYLVRYAGEQPDLALLSVNAFQRDLSDPNALIRALALRVMAAIRVPLIRPLLLMSVQKCAADSSPHVRKTVANALPLRTQSALASLQDFLSVCTVTHGA